MLTGNACHMPELTIYNGNVPGVEPVILWKNTEAVPVIQVSWMYAARLLVPAIEGNNVVNEQHGGGKR